MTREPSNGEGAEIHFLQGVSRDYTLRRIK